MDRNLSNHEKDEFRKKFGRTSPKNSKSYLFRLVFIVFLFTPSLINRGANSLGISMESDDVVAHPENYDEAILRVYAARTWGPKGMFAVHSWIAMKRQGSDVFEVNQVIGWKQERNGNVLFRETHVPIDSWWGNQATLLLDLRGPNVEEIIDKVDAAIEAYPYSNEYTLFPGPNSNTFVSWVGLKVPEMGLDLPSTAIGKDWRPLNQSLGMSASGSGIQASLHGLLGTSIGFEEGLEVNILGLNFELDLFDLAIEMPLFGRYKVWYLISYLIIWLFLKKWINKTKSKNLELE